MKVAVARLILVIFRLAFRVALLTAIVFALVVSTRWLWTFNSTAAMIIGGMVVVTALVYLWTWASDVAGGYR